jgi:hypothetical protein
MGRARLSMSSPSVSISSPKKDNRILQDSPPSSVNKYIQQLLNQANENSPPPRNSTTLKNQDTIRSHITPHQLEFTLVVNNNISRNGLATYPLLSTPSGDQPSPNTQHQDAVVLPNVSEHTTVIPRKDNFPFGDLLTVVKNDDSLRIYLQNANGIRPYSSWDRWRTACHKLAELKNDIFGTVETNIDWNSNLQATARRISQSAYQSSLVSTSSSSDHGISDFQPGGTITTITEKWTGRAVKSFADTRGLGRWSGYTLQRSNNTYLHIVSAYRLVSVSGPNHDNTHTFSQQNWNLLRDEGIPVPDPVKQFYLDITSVIIQAHANGDEVILMMDANETLGDNKYLPRFLSQTNMSSLIQGIHQAPPTYNRGTKCIDFIFGSNRLTQHVTQSGYLSFYEGGWPLADHRAAFIDINQIAVFGATTATIYKPPVRRLTSKSSKGILKFLTGLSTSNQIEELHQQLSALLGKSSWTQADHDTFELIDKNFTEALLAAESKASLPSIPWSPKLHIATLIYSYWSITRSAELNHRDALVQLLDIQSQLPPGAIFQNQPSYSVLQQKRLARKNLIDITIEARSHRDEFL